MFGAKRRYRNEVVEHVADMGVPKEMVQLRTCTVGIDEGLKEGFSVPQVAVMTAVSCLDYYVENNFIEYTADIRNKILSKVASWEELGLIDGDTVDFA